MLIREGRSEDASGIAAVIHAMNELHAVTQQPVEVTTSTVAENLARIRSDASSSAFVAEASDGTVVGYGAAHWVPFLFLSGGEAYVTELFVRPSESGKGVGSRLLDAIVAEANKRGCARVSLLNSRDVESYRRGFYRKRGWVERDRMVNLLLPIQNAPNKAPEPTTTAVTPRATESIS